MNSDQALRVADVLERPLFKNANVVSGKGGLNRKIRWVHILEISQFDTLIHGQEMILSTGVGLIDNSAKEKYLLKLIEHGASCLCIELGPYFDSVPAEIAEISERNDFPIIVFSEKVRFIDITHDLHSMIINRQYKMLENLEKVSRDFEHATLTSQGTSKILKILHQSTNADVIFFPFQSKPQFVPGGTAADTHQRLFEVLRGRQEPEAGESPYVWNAGEESCYLVKSVGATEQTWAYLALCLNNRQPEQFDYLVLDRAGTALAQDMLRKKYIEEKKLYTEQIWLDDLLNGRLKDEDQIRMQLSRKSVSAREWKFRVCIIDFIDAFESPNIDMTEDENDSSPWHIFILVRNIFENGGFKTYLTSRGSQVIALLIDTNPAQSQKSRLSRTIDSLQTAYQKSFTADGGRMVVGFSRQYKNLTDAPQGYREAKHVLKVNDIDQEKTTHLYEELGIYRLLLQLDNEAVLRTFVSDHIGPLIEYDRQKGGDLLLTLKVYLESDCSKQITSQKLFIVRQTIYHRLEKIKELLGDFFMEPERRISIEVALRIHGLLK